MTYVAAIDQGTSSTRVVIFDHAGNAVSVGQLEHQQIYPQPGWVEHSAKEIWRNTREAIGFALGRANLTRHDIETVGITNQRETTLIWDRRTGTPIYNAIVWQDTRTQDLVDTLAVASPLGIDRYREVTGLPLATYFSATKIVWLLDNIEGARARAEAGELLFGTMDSWLLWNLTGGPTGGVHATDVTNASRTMLMDLTTLTWSTEILEELGIPAAIMPQIRASSDAFGTISSSSLLRETPICGILGDQQAAAFGQAAFARGGAKNTYGTGNFMVANTGPDLVRSTHGLITTVAYQLANQPPQYAIEGSIAVTGSLIQWLRDNLGIIDSAAQIESLAASVDNSGGVVFVPAFSGLFAPYWRPDARGAILGLTGYADKRHIARAALESVAYQSLEVLDAVSADTGIVFKELRVDGGMVVNTLLLQIQADVLGIPVVRPVVTETTALGAAYAAGLAVGFWRDLDQIQELWREGARWEPTTDADARAHGLAVWRKAVSKTLGWVE